LLYSNCTSGLGAVQCVPITSATQTKQLTIHMHRYLAEMFTATTLEVLTTMCRRRPAGTCFAGTHCLYLQVQTHVHTGQKHKEPVTYIMGNREA